MSTYLACQVDADMGRSLRLMSIYFRSDARRVRREMVGTFSDYGR